MSFATAHHPDNCTDRPGGLARSFPVGRRDFRPSEWLEHVPRHLEGLETPVIDAKRNEWAHVTCPGLYRPPAVAPDCFDEHHKSERVIAGDGGCRKRDGKINDWNMSDSCRGSTSNEAELEAAIEGMRRYRQIIESGEREPDQTVIVKSDSRCVVNGVIALSEKRRPKAWANGRRSPDAKDWDFLMDVIRDLEDKDIQVLSVWVPRDWTSDADNMVNEACRPTGKCYGIEEGDGEMEGGGMETEQESEWEEFDEVESQDELEKDAGQQYGEAETEESEESEEEDVAEDDREEGGVETSASD